MGPPDQRAFWRGFFGTPGHGWDHDDGTWGALEDAAGSPAHQQIVEGGVAVGTDHDVIGLERCGLVDDRGHGGAGEMNRVGVREFVFQAVFQATELLGGGLGGELVDLRDALEERRVVGHRRHWLRDVEQDDASVERTGEGGRFGHHAGGDGGEIDRGEDGFHAGREMTRKYVSGPRAAAQGL